MVVNGTEPGDWPRVAELARRFPGLVRPSFGLHPWQVPARPADWPDQLDRWLELPGAAVGEIGLDRRKPGLPWAGQEEVFVHQLARAAARRVPASIHCLQAWDELVRLLESQPRPACGFLLHSFGGPAAVVERLASLGAYFSLSGALARSGRAGPRDLLRQIPPDRLLLETDAPDQAPPEEHRVRPLTDPATGKPLNHPANLAAVYRFAAAVLGRDEAELAAGVEANFLRLWGRP